MHIFPTDEEVEKVAELLVNKYQVSPQVLGQLFNTDQRDQANSILLSLGNTRLAAIDVARLLVQREGPGLFAGGREEIRNLRGHLLRQLSDKQVQYLFNRHSPSNKSITSPSHMRKPLAEKKWHSGKHWARDFVAALDFPPIFAGLVQGEKIPTIHDIPPLKIPPKLAGFQIDLKERMLEVLTQDGDRTRCVVTLPTGGGKTRVAVEAFIDWMQPRFAA
ncbi:MAG: ATP-dependent helicase, partial [Bacteroidota bacterium]